MFTSMSAGVATYTFIFMIEIKILIFPYVSPSTIRCYLYEDEDIYPYLLC